MTRNDETLLGPVVARLRGTLALGGYLTYISALALVAGVIGVASGDVLDGLYGLAVGVLGATPVVLGWQQEVTVHQNGFVLRRLTGTRTVLFAEVKRVRRIDVSSFLRGNVKVVEVTVHQGKDLDIGWIEDPTRLARLLSGAEPAPMPGWQPPVATGGGDR